MVLKRLWAQEPIIIINMGVWKWQFLVFYKYLSDEVETVFLGKRENAAKTFCIKSALLGAF